jgi:hypothetical protein
MIHLSERTRRGLAEAVGIPTIIGGLALVLLTLTQVLGRVV